MAMNIATIFPKFFQTQAFGLGFVPCRSAPAYR
jgi:hypothetical protein